ncbi:xanthine dehydrogenase family protein molybdopterin-binding subunit [Paucibacter sp. R3-3]|uniref:Xanthine dehydrogenase family protein molybdopterin-binding subunit n=1 Tax=Roseateles agri TaxID=3098619 RepID=A0ABU5DMR1_9BURK|nr:xanthine dehydrogenase family protein molybdopterin-binding subunit [Paucibacter sp. R3-3]MDY0747590.1 xanthine dehydrogenase family protein molybdopterin-binding subunit [Paucibacter sp. R3-3]
MTTTRIGMPTPRIDGRLKVTGSARYAADQPTPNPAYGWLHVSRIARGRIVAIDERAARAVPGVLEVFTWRNIGAIQPGDIQSQKGFMGTSIAPMQPRIFHDGQIVALVAADTPEAAREAAQRLVVRYAEDAPSAGFGSAGLTSGPAHKSAEPPEPDPQVGNFDGAFARAAVAVDQHYATSTQHHNPIELFSTLCAWSADRLTVWEGSQNVSGYKHGLAQQLGIAPEQIQVISPFVGGAFGSRGSLTQRTAIVALAARRLGRPLKLEVTRAQGFGIATYRAETRHRVRVAATPAGKLVALSHEGEEISSRPDDYKVSGIETTTRLYACPNVASKVTILHADRNTPGFMRSPPETPYLYALECAVDELAWRLKMDPIELRRANDTMREPIKGLPYTSRQLMPCFDAAARAFGWSRRGAEPRSMRDGDWLIGWGCASSIYPTQMAPATARVRLTPQGRATVQTGTHEIGNGAYTAIAITAADQLGLAVENVEVLIGDSELPPAPVAGGSNSTASVCNAVAKACEEIRRKLGKQPLPTHGAIEAYAENVPHGAKPEQVAALYKGVSSIGGGFRLKDRVQAAFGASFVEVRVHARTCEIRTPRIVGAYAFGQVVNPKAAESQLMGGQIWGVSCALHEATDVDRGSARYVNTNLADYLIPVNADIEQHQVIILPESDRQVNPLGIKGVGELANVGMNAAVANAVFHATGVRVRHMPIRVEDLLGS